MGSRSDWDTMHYACATLDKLGVAYERKVVSAHRTPDLLFEYAASAADRGLRIIIAGAGGAAHLPGMAASKTHLPVIGVPVESKVLRGVDSLLSIVQMPAGIPVATVAIGKPVRSTLVSLQLRCFRESLVRFARRWSIFVRSRRPMCWHILILRSRWVKCV